MPKGHSAHFAPNPNDYIIVVMGPTGSGKSNFINKLTGNAEAGTASNLRSDTQIIIPYTVPCQPGPGQIILVDTPGFDDTYRPDTEILRIVADWLIQKYPEGGILQVTGIIYLHRITDNRVSGSVYKNLQMFGRLCGDLPLSRARLITTMWDKAKDPAVVEQRQRQLEEDFWKQLIAEGARPAKFHNTTDSAWGIVNDLLNGAKAAEDLLLQEELVKLQMHLNETEAAKVLYSRFQKLLVEQKKMLKELADDAKMQNDPALARSLQEECDKINAQLQMTFEEMNKMKIGIPKRIILWLRRLRSRGHAVKVDNLRP